MMISMHFFSCAHISQLLNFIGLFFFFCTHIGKTKSNKPNYKIDSTGSMNKFARVEREAEDQWRGGKKKEVIFLCINQIFKLLKDLLESQKSNI
jgi:hypothetical protein